jgi:hypothetical protein
MGFLTEIKREDWRDLLWEATLEWAQENGSISLRLVR